MEFIRSSGPGGQNVNKVATAVRLRFAVRSCSLLPEAVSQRLMIRAGGKMNDQGELIIEARRYRTQERNRADALQRLAAMIAAAWPDPTPRRATRPTLASRQRRLVHKKQRGVTKQQRKQVNEDKE